MKKNFLLLVLLGGIMLVTPSCKQKGCTDVNACNYDADAEKNDGSCINKGTVTFWQNGSSLLEDTYVEIGTSTSYITADYTSSPNCSASGCASFTLCPGTYTYYAEEDLPGTGYWSGTITVTSDGCTKLELY